MITQDEIAKLAREYVERSAEEVGTKLDPESWAFDCMMTQTKDVINFLLRTHCIVSKEKVNEEYQKAQAQIKDGRELGIHGLVTHGGAKEALLESLFDAETFKNSEG